MSELATPTTAEILAITASAAENTRLIDPRRANALPGLKILRRGSVLSVRVDTTPPNGQLRCEGQPVKHYTAAALFDGMRADTLPAVAGLAIDCFAHGRRSLGTVATGRLRFLTDEDGHAIAQKSTTADLERLAERSPQRLILLHAAALTIDEALRAITMQSSSHHSPAAN